VSAYVEGAIPAFAWCNRKNPEKVQSGWGGGQWDRTSDLYQKTILELLQPLKIS